MSSDGGARSPSVMRKPGRTAAARRANSRTDSYVDSEPRRACASGSGSASGGTGYSRSPASRSGMRLVASTVRLGAASSRAPTIAARLDELLEVVEHEQQLAVAEVVVHGVGEVASRDPRRTRRAPSDLRRSRAPASVTALRSTNEDPVGEPVELVRGRDLQREPGLARAAGARQRQQPARASRLGDLGDLRSRPTNDVRGGGRFVRRASSERSGGNVGLEPVDHEVVEMLRVLEILQSVHAEVAERDAVGKAVRDERARGRRRSRPGRRVPSRRSAPPG